MLTHPLLVDARPLPNDDLTGARNLIKMSSSLLNIPNASSKSEEFSLKDIKVVVDSEEQNWFKQARVGKFLGCLKLKIYLLV